jgi:Tfp pilus assembly protein PilZ
MNDETFYGTIEDISPHGMFVGGEREIRIGTELMLKFLLPWQELHLVETRAKVTWSNGIRPRRKSYLPPGFGVEFVNLEPKTLDALNDFITYSLLRQPHVSI